MDKSPFYKKNEYIDPAKQLKPADDGKQGSKRSAHTIGKLQHSTTAFLWSNTRRGQGGVVPSSIPEYDKYFLTLNPYYIKQDEVDRTLIFESRFECGNLKRATKIGEFEYDLTMKPDHNS